MKCGATAASIYQRKLAVPRHKIHALAVSRFLSGDCQIGVTGFKAGRYTLIDYLTCFEMGQGATNCYKSGQPASKQVKLQIRP